MHLRYAFPWFNVSVFHMLFVYKKMVFLFWLPNGINVGHSSRIEQLAGAVCRPAQQLCLGNADFQAAE